MKKLSLILSMICLSLFIVSCNSNEDLKDLKNQQLSVDEFFQKVSSMQLKTSEEKVIYIDYEFDNENKTVRFLSSLEKEPDFFILHSKEEVKQRVLEDSYEVFCDNGGDGTNNWVKTCDGKWSCGGLIYDCLKQGGCAKICKLKMAYSPQNRSFYLLK